ncbi:MAG TPA: hypothetical protein RMG48_16325 [Myxococcales bacterium LLY-WYZ-16_1]|nr:hypothetical protein [Myxococcales bacterium LLY-WYZ-16_1]
MFGTAWVPALHVFLLAAVTTSTPSATNLATDRDSTDAARVWVEAGTDVPVLVGGRVEVEAWHRLRAWTSLGVLPDAYLELIDGVAQGLGGYNEETSDLVVGSLQSSLVWRVHLGWRPFRKLGFGIDAGYTLATLGGATRGSEILAAALGRPVPDAIGNAWTLDSTLHLLGFEASWRFPLFDRFELRTALGFVGTVAASTQATPLGTSSVFAERFSADLEAYLNGVYTSYVFTPYGSVGAGYRFGP